MKPLLISISSVVVGVVIGTGLFMAMPPNDEGSEVLAFKIYSLEDEVKQLQQQALSLPTHRHWEHFEQHLDTYEGLQFERFSAEQAGHPDFGGEQWGGVISGPTLDVLLAARVAQEVVPVYFDRIAVDDDAARMTFYVLGAREN